MLLTRVTNLLLSFSFNSLGKLAMTLIVFILLITLPIKFSLSTEFSSSVFSVINLGLAFNNFSTKLGLPN